MLARSNIHLLPLPPYSPELNPVEVIGDLIKDRIANTLLEHFRRLWKKPSVKNCDPSRPKCRTCTELGFTPLASRTSKRFRNAE